MGILTFFFPQTNASEAGKEGEREGKVKRMNGLKGRVDKAYLLAQECHFLQSALCAGRGASFVKVEQALKMSNLFGKKKSMFKMLNGKKSIHLKTKYEMVERKTFISIS